MALLRLTRDISLALVSGLTDARTPASRKLAIAGGFLYAADCDTMRRLGTSSTSVVHCGSDFSSASVDGGTDGFGDGSSGGGGDGGGDSGGGGCGGGGGGD